MSFVLDMRDIKMNRTKSCPQASTVSLPDVDKYSNQYQRVWKPSTRDWHRELGARGSEMPPKGRGKVTGLSTSYTGMEGGQLKGR